MGLPNVYSNLFLFRGMQSLYTNDKLDPKIHSAIASLFPEFIGNNSNVIPQPPLNTSSSAAASALLPPPPLPAPSPSISTNTTHSSDSLMNSIPLPLPPPPQLQPVTKWKPLFDTLSCCLTKGANSQKSMDLCRGLLTVYLQEVNFEKPPFSPNFIVHFHLIYSSAAPYPTHHLLTHRKTRLLKPSLMLCLLHC